MSNIQLEAEIPEEYAGKRIDWVLAQLFNDYSRSTLQSWLKSGYIQINQAQVKAKDKAKAHALVVVDAPVTVVHEDQAQAIDLDKVYEDEYLMVLNKPAGLTVHPGAGNPDGTLLNASTNHHEAKN